MPHTSRVGWRRSRAGMVADPLQLRRDHLKKLLLGETGKSGILCLRWRLRKLRTQPIIPLRSGQKYALRPSESQMEISDDTAGEWDGCLSERGTLCFEYRSMLVLALVQEDCGITRRGMFS